jgi:hypothetical protein
MRFPLEIFEAMGAAFPPAKPTGVQELQKAVTRLAKANQAPRRADTNRRKRTRKGADRENCRRAPTTVRYAVTPGAKADAVFLERSDHLSNSGPDGAVFFTDGSILVDGKTWIGKGSYLCRIVHHRTERPIVPMQLDFEVA